MRMMNQETSQSQDDVVIDDPGTSDALQSFAHTIQEKAGPSLDDESLADAAGGGNITSMLGDGLAGTALARARGFLRRQPVVGVVSGIAVGFALGRLRK